MGCDIGLQRIRARLRGLGRLVTRIVRLGRSGEGQWVTVSN